MPQLVVLGAQLQCTFGMAASQLVVLPQNKTLGGNAFAANIMDYVPMTNIMPFGMCQSLANPMVAAATAAAMGVLTPMPCIPMTTAPWSPGCPTVMLGNAPALDSTSMCICNWAGVITITSPGETTITIP